MESLISQLGDVLSDGDFCARYPFIRQIFDVGDLEDLQQLADLKEKAAAPTATDSEDNQ